MNFLWLDINASYSHSSLALPALHAQLGENILNNCKWHTVQGTLKTPASRMVSQLVALSPDCIFATGWLFNINHLLETLAKANALLPHTKIFLGGPEFLGDNESFLRSHPFVTAVFKGEGEERFPDFIRTLICGEEWRNVEGFEYLQNNLYHASTVQTVQDFSRLVPPEHSPFFNWEKAFVQLETSRGCFNSCRFCVSGIDKSPVQNLPVGRLRERLQRIQAHGIKEVRVLDRTFNANPARAIELLELFREFHPHIQFHIEVHPALLAPAFKEYLQTIPSHLLHVEAGLQSLQEPVIRGCRRAGDPDKAIEGVQFLLGLNRFEVHADLIAGLPGYTWEALLKDTLALMEIGPQEIQLESLKLLPGTYFRNNSPALEIRFSTVSPYEVLQTPDITYPQLQKAMVLSKMLDFWYNDARWRDLFKTIFRNRQDLLETLVGELEETEFIIQPVSFESKSLLLYHFCKKHVPEMLFATSLQWVRNGLSIKKEPAAILHAWNPKDIDLYNPLLEPENPRLKYYYACREDLIYWFSYDNETDRNKPSKELVKRII